MQKKPSADNQDPSMEYIAGPIEVCCRADGVFGQDRAHTVIRPPFPSHSLQRHHTVHIREVGGSSPLAPTRSTLLSSGFARRGSREDNAF